MRLVSENYKISFFIVSTAAGVGQCGGPKKSQYIQRADYIFILVL